jgi:hypothetical protein
MLYFQGFWKSGIFSFSRLGNMIAPVQIFFRDNLPSRINMGVLTVSTQIKTFSL